MKGVPRVKVPNLTCLLLALAVSACSTPSPKPNDLGNNDVFIPAQEEVPKHLLGVAISPTEALRALSARIEKAGAIPDTGNSTPAWLLGHLPGGRARGTPTTITPSVTDLVRRGADRTNSIANGR